MGVRSVVDSAVFFSGANLNWQVRLLPVLFSCCINLFADLLFFFLNLFDPNLDQVPVCTGTDAAAGDPGVCAFSSPGNNRIMRLRASASYNSMVHPYPYTPFTLQRFLMSEVPL